MSVLSDRDIRAALETAQELGAFMFVHPNNVAGADRLKSYYLANLIGKPGQFNLSRFEGIGREPSLIQDRADGSEVLLLKFLKADHLKLGELKKVLTEHLFGFCEIFGKE